MHAGGGTALAEMRALRRGKRIADQEWFELAYRAYVAGLCWIGGAFALSSIVGDDTFTPSQREDVLRYAPGVVGLVAAVVIGLGLRWNAVLGIRRGAADLEAFRAAKQVLDEGHVLGIFPEGTRSLDGALQERYGRGPVPGQCYLAGCAVRFQGLE